MPPLPTPVALERFCAALARGLVEAQDLLDGAARESLLAWEQQGLPPAGFAWSRCRLRCGVAYAARAKRALAERTALALTPRLAGEAALAVTIRYVPRPQDEDP